MSSNRISTYEAMKLLGYKKRASFNRWCSLNGVDIYRNHGSNRHFVLKDDFENALKSNRIKLTYNVYDIHKYPGLMKAYLNVQSELLTHTQKKNSPEKSSYIKSENEEAIASRLLDL